VQMPFDANAILAAVGRPARVVAGAGQCLEVAAVASHDPDPPAAADARHDNDRPDNCCDLLQDMPRLRPPSNAPSHCNGRISSVGATTLAP
jgi:hypothetical protein